jgi:hypothetical protein
MNEMQMLFWFCIFYSGVMSLVLWANMMSRKRLEAQPNEGPFSEEYDRGA